MNGYPSAVNRIALAVKTAVQERLHEDQDVRQILANSGWLAVRSLVGICGGILVGAWVARYLGPKRLGLYSYARSLVALLAPLSALGLDRVAVKDIVNDPLSKDQIIGTGYVLRILSGLATVVVAIGIASLLRPDDRLLLWAVAIVAFAAPLQSFEVIDWWFRSRLDSRLTAYAKTASFAVVATIQVALILARAPLLAFVACALIEAALSGAGMAVAYRISGNSVSSWQPRLRRAGQLLREGWPLILSGVAVMIYMRIDQLMLGGMKGDHAVGIYSVAVGLSEAWYFIPTILVASSLPSIVERKRRSAAAYQERLQLLFNSMVALSYGICLPAAIASGTLVRLLYGKGYETAGSVLAVLLLAGPFVALGVARETWMVTENLTLFSFATTVAGALTNVGLNYLLIPEYGPLGAAIATAVSYPVAAVVSCFAYSRTRAIGLMMLKAMVLLG